MAVLARGLAADGGLGDVDPVLAEAGADAPDHAGKVGVAEEREVGVVELEVEALAPGLEQVRAVQLAERRADHAVAADRDADEVGEVAGDELLGLGDLDPALLGQRRRVDEVDLLLGVAVQHALERGEREQARVAAREVAEVLALDALDARALGERGGEAAEALHERQVRAEHLHVLRADGGDVDRGRDDAAGERGDDLLGGLDAGAVLRLGGARRPGAA